GTPRVPGLPGVLVSAPYVAVRFLGVVHGGRGHGLPLVGAGSLTPVTLSLLLGRHQSGAGLPAPLPGACVAAAPVLAPRGARPRDHPGPLHTELVVIHYQRVTRARAPTPWFPLSPLPRCGPHNSRGPSAGTAPGNYSVLSLPASTC